MDSGICEGLVFQGIAEAQRVTDNYFFILDTKLALFTLWQSPSFLIVLIFTDPKVGQSTEGNWLSTTELCSLTSGSCSLFTNLPELSYHPRAVRIDNRRVFVLPNQNGRAWIFNQNGNTFSQIPNLLEKRDRASVGLINGEEIVVAGGSGSKTSEIFNIATNEWRQGPDLPINGDLCCTSSVQYGNSFLIVGGFNGGVQDSILRYDSSNHKWVTLPQKLDTGRDNFAAFLIPNYCGKIGC